MNKKQSLKAQSYKLKARHGFTLAELLVAIGLFSIVVSIAVGGLANVLKTERETTNLLSVNSNASLVLEQMAKEIRTGYNFCVGGQTCASASELSFRNAKEIIVTYCLRGEVLLRGAGGAPCGGTGYAPLTANTIAVEQLVFSLTGISLTDLDQSRITISMTVKPKAGGGATGALTLETTVSPRVIDYAEGVYQGSYQSAYEAGYEGYYEGPYYSEGGY